MHAYLEHLLKTIPGAWWVRLYLKDQERVVEITYKPAASNRDCIVGDLVNRLSITPTHVIKQGSEVAFAVSDILQIVPIYE